MILYKERGSQKSRVRVNSSKENCNNFANFSDNILWRFSHHSSDSSDDCSHLFGKISASRRDIGRLQEKCAINLQQKYLKNILLSLLRRCYLCAENKALFLGYSTQLIIKVTRKMCNFIEIYLSSKWVMCLIQFQCWVVFYNEMLGWLGLYCDMSKVGNVNLYGRQINKHDKISGWLKFQPNRTRGRPPPSQFCVT